MPLRSGRRSEDMGMGQYVKGGYLWMSGTNKMAVGATSVLKVTMSVAPAQPKAITIIGVSLYADSEVFTDIHINPTTNLPTTAKRVDNAILGLPYTGVCTFKADMSAAASPLSGGTITGVSFAVGEATGGGHDSPSSIIIQPGYVIGFNTVTTGATNIMMNVSWVEV